MTNQERLQANNAKIEAIQQTLANKAITTGEIEITENGKHDVAKYASANVNVQPNLTTKEITANGTYNASDDGVDGYSSVDVDLPIPDLSQTTATENDVVSGKVFYNASGEKTTGTYVDRLQYKCDVLKSLACEFYGYKGTDYTILDGLDMSKVEDFYQMFYNNENMVNAPQLDFSSATRVNEIYRNCRKLKSASLNLPRVTQAQSCFYSNYALEMVDISNIDNITDISSIFYQCSVLREVHLPKNLIRIMSQSFSYCSSIKSVTINNLGDKSGNGNFSNIFSSCIELETINLLDLHCSGTASYSGMFNACLKLTNLDLRNISKGSLQIGSGTYWGHLLTLDSLLNTIKELWTNTSGTKTLTMGTANLEKLANVYVKLIDITDEMRAEDQYIDNKAPFVQCESTDEGAMLITEYVTTVKKWQLA